MERGGSVDKGLEVGPEGKSAGAGRPGEQKDCGVSSLVGLDAGELRTGEGRSVLSHLFSPCPAEQVPNLNSSR